MTDLAPVAFFVFKRPLTTLQALYSLARCPEAARTRLHVFSDGPRSPADEEGVRLTREVVRSRQWCGEVIIHEAPRNKGLARSVIDGVSGLCASDGKVIVVEDDLLLSSGFLAYMNEGLTRYQNDDKVMTISGYSLDLGRKDGGSAFIPMCESWGWATWSRAWAHFEESPTELDLLTRRDFRRHFDLDDAYPYAAVMEDQIAGRADSWAIRWWWAMHRVGGIGLFPRRSLVENVGNGPGATHTREGSVIPSAEWSFENSVTSFPSDVAVDTSAFDAWKRALRGRHRDRFMSLVACQAKIDLSLETRLNRMRDSLHILGQP